MVTWLDGISRAYCAFHRADRSTCLEFVQRIFEICVNECLLSVYKRVQTKATNVLKVRRQRLSFVRSPTNFCFSDDHQSHSETSSRNVARKSVVEKSLPNRRTRPDLRLHAVVELRPSSSRRHVGTARQRLVRVLSKRKTSRRNVF